MKQDIAQPPENRPKTSETNLAKGEPHRWKPGQSGNPGGRPKGIFGKAALRQLRERAENGQTNLDAVVGAQVDKAIAKGDTRAAEFLRDTVDGRPIAADEGAGQILSVTFGVVGGGEQELRELAKAFEPEEE